ncbi:MAG: hypothetical protein EA369_05175 [Bradymonadales bacterium]|nr:MAG: hypothetical protein EA369_05175 [Bradymonadales bacterium]
MFCFKQAISLILGAVILGWSLELQADGLRLHLFDTEGNKRSLQELSEGDFEARWIPNIVHSDCPAELEKICISWKLHIPEGMTHESVAAKAIRDTVKSALSFWNEQLGEIELEASFLGFVDEARIPYLKDEADELILDSEGQAIVEKHWLFSFSDSEIPSFQVGARSDLKQIFSVDDFRSLATADWTGIFLNPRYSPWKSCSSQCLSQQFQSFYSVRSVLVFEIGRALGLEASTHARSVMNPIFEPNRQRTHLGRVQEVAWLRYLYGNNLQGTKLEGKIMSGLDGEPIAGASVLLIPSLKLEEYSKSDNNWDLVDAVSWTREDGSFSFREIPPGDYILLSQVSSDLMSRPFLFGDWAVSTGLPTYFSPNFYDGKARESNRETSFYSPRLAILAATLHVLHGVPNRGVELITNESLANSDPISAQGATHETLSDYVMKDILPLLQEEFAFDQEWRAGGCMLSPHTRPISWAFLFILFVLALFGFRILQASKHLPSR